MRKLLVVAIVFFALLLAVTLWWRRHEWKLSQMPPVESRGNSTADSSSLTAAGETPAMDVSNVMGGPRIELPYKPPASPHVSRSVVPTVATLPELTNLPPQTVMENMRSAFRQYAARFKGNPVGTNPEITAALSGGNVRQVQFLNEEDGLRVNDRGELVDSWGVPFFFHQLSAHEMEIRSGGPDRVMWNSDDLVIK